MDSKCASVSMEIAVNFATGYLLYKERIKVRKESKQHADRGEKSYLAKSTMWLKDEVFDKMVSYEDDSVKMDVDEETEDQENEEVDDDEVAQKKYVDECVSEMVTDYGYAVSTMKKVMEKVGDRALQVNI